jgi:hypothetical protein
MEIIAKDNLLVFYTVVLVVGGNLFFFSFFFGGLIIHKDILWGVAGIFYCRQLKDHII